MCGEKVQASSWLGYRYFVLSDTMRYVDMIFDEMWTLRTHVPPPFYPVAQNVVQIWVVSFPKRLCLPTCPPDKRALGKGWRTPDTVSGVKLIDGRKS
jgi:hypothetical protein